MEPLDDFVSVYQTSMNNTLKALKIYQEFIKNNNQMVENLTQNLIDMFEKNNMNNNVSFLLGVMTGYQKAKDEAEPTPKKPAIDPTHFIM